MILIQKDSENQLTANFKEKEFFSNSPDIGGTAHKFDETVIHALQFIRTHYDVKIQVLSTYRTPKHNKDCGGKPSSLHLFYRAIDWKFYGTGAKEAMKQYQEDIENRGEVFQTLRKMGVRGIGLYKNFNHIDSRTDKIVPIFNHVDEIGRYSYFDYR